MLGACFALLLAIAAPSAAASGLADHVNTFAGTRPGPGTFGGGHNFPGAAVPFGMVQWSPDTTPADKNGGGGYDYRDTHIKGFSLTHLSGAGCSLYGDFPFLPTTEPLESSPAASGSSLDGELQPGFSHSGERARPGYYSMRLNPAQGAGINTELTATTRTGMARFTFPPNPHSSVLVNAGGSAQPDDFASVQVNPDGREIDGAASSGLFCGQRPRYKVYFAAVFNRPFAAYGTWQRDQFAPGSTSASDSQTPPTNPATSASAGAYATFDTGENKVVLVRVGVSFVSVEDARANLAAEDPGAGFGTIATRAQRSWNAALGRIQVSGGSARHLDTFYTALYHSFLAPRTFSDFNGSYPGMDGLIHNAGGRIQYADFSGWDIYRTEIQLLSILTPKRAAEMISSLLADAAQSGCLPRWPYANGQSMTMVGDSADPIIASAAAFGAGGFNSGAALAAMVKGATQPCQSTNGEYLERQGLGDYESLGYIPFDVDTNIRNANSIYGSPEDVWGSAATTLEYAVDDFAIAQFAARARRDRSTYSEFIRRSATWRRLYNPATGLIEPRYASGEFPNPYNDLEGGGFAEGNSYQYTWMVPQDPSGLFRKMGGRAKAASRLDYFLRELNGSVGGTHTDHALLGNEPTLQAPWLYDWAQRPYRTQEAVRRALLTLYDTSPDGYPGNDDLGTLSAWYVFGALGLYPEVPGVGLLAVGSPLFGRAAISLPHHKRALITATAFTFRKSKPPKGKKHRKPPKPRKVALSPASAPYIRGVRFNGRPFGQPWTTYCALARGGRIDFQLGPSPNRKWGDSAAAAPPSFGPNRTMPKSACTP
jgi:predicted alpha-1,2-mannosidase